MLKIVFFAQLREQLATSELQLDVVPSNVGALRDLLAEKAKNGATFSWQSIVWRRSIR